MWLESELDVGSCFGVALPLPEADRKTAQPSLPKRIGQVLLVSDHLISRGIVERQLHSAKVKTATATQADTAAKLARQAAPDLVILDHDLAETDALSVLASLRQGLPDCPVVLLCATVTDVTSAVASDANLVALSKPLLWRDLCGLGRARWVKGATGPRPAMQPSENARRARQGQAEGALCRG